MESQQAIHNKIVQEYLEYAKDVAAQKMAQASEASLAASGNVGFGADINDFKWVFILVGVILAIFAYFMHQLLQDEKQGYSANFDIAANAAQATVQNVTKTEVLEGDTTDSDAEEYSWAKQAFISGKF